MRAPRTRTPARAHTRIRAPRTHAHTDVRQAAGLALNTAGGFYFAWAKHRDAAAAH